MSGRRSPPSIPTALVEGMICTQSHPTLDLRLLCPWTHGCEVASRECALVLPSFFTQHLLRAGRSVPRAGHRTANETQCQRKTHTSPGLSDKQAVTVHLILLSGALFLRLSVCFALTGSPSIFILVGRSQTRHFCYRKS